MWANSIAYDLLATEVEYRDFLAGYNDCFVLLKGGRHGLAMVEKRFVFVHLDQAHDDRSHSQAKLQDHVRRKCYWQLKEYDCVHVSGMYSSCPDIEESEHVPQKYVKKCCYVAVVVSQC